MTFEECIHLAISAEKVKASKGAEAIDAYRAAYDEAIFNGDSPRLADDKAALAAVEALGKRATDKKWQKVHELRAAADIYSGLMSAADPAHWLYLFGNKLDITRKRITLEASVFIENNLEKFRPRAAGTWIPIKDMDDVVRGSYGGGTAEGKALAKELANLDDWLTRRTNLEGANLIHNPNGRISLLQDRQKLNAYARTVGRDTAKNEWIDEHMAGLDWTLVTKDDELVPSNQRESFLSELYDGITTSGNLTRSPTQSFQMALAQKLTHPEFFYYKDADTWLKMNDKYGMGTMYTQQLQKIDMRARDIALLEHLGPNPATMLQFLENVAKKRASGLDFQKPPKRENQGFTYGTRQEVDTFKERYKLFTGEVEAAEGWLATAGGTARGVIAPMILPFALIANLGDLGFSRHAMMFYNIPATGYMTRMFNSLAGLTQAEKRRWAIRNLGGMESAVGAMVSEARYTGMLDGAYWIRRFNDSFFRVTLQTPFTQGQKHAWAIHAQAQVADFADKPFHEVPWHQAMADFGITPAEWDIYRKTPIRNEFGEKLLSPLDMAQRTDIDTHDARRIADKFFDFQIDAGYRIAPEPSSRIQVALGKTMNPNKWRGQSQLAQGFIKQFSAMVFMTYLKDAMGNPNPWTRTKNIARFITILTFAGAFITQAKEMLRGNDPADMRDPAFWIRAALNGGSFGFAGDIIFGTLGAYQHGGIAEVMTGPVPQFLDRLKNLTFDDTVNFAVTAGTKGLDRAFEEQKFTRDAAAMFNRYSPIPWEFDLMFQRLILDDLLELADPRGYQQLRRVRTERENRGQGAWWGVGDQAPVGPPNLGGAVGIGRE